MFYVHFRCFFFCKRVGGGFFVCWFFGFLGFVFFNRNHSQILIRFNDEVWPVVADLEERFESSASSLRLLMRGLSFGNCESEQLKVRSSEKEFRGGGE